MKKSTLLSLATVGTIVATSIGTFAAWDMTNVTSTGTVTIEKGVVMEATSMTFTPTARTTLSTDATGFTQSTDTTITVKDVPDSIKTGYKLQYTATVTPPAGGNENDVNVEVNDPNADTLAGGASDVHTATVKVTPTDNALGKEYSISVKAELVAK